MENTYLESGNASINICENKITVVKHPSQTVTNTIEFDITDIKMMAFHIPNLFTKGHIKFTFKHKIIDSKDNKLSSLQVQFEQNDANAYHIMARKLAKELKLMLIQE